MSESNKLREEFRCRATMSWEELEGKKKDLKENSKIDVEELPQLLQPQVNGSQPLLCKLGFHSWEYFSPARIRPFQDSHFRCKRCDMWKVIDIHAGGMMSFPEIMFHFYKQKPEIQRKLLVRDW